jgi:hypothetical protein
MQVLDQQPEPYVSIGRSWRAAQAVPHGSWRCDGVCAEAGSHTGGGRETSNQGMQKTNLHSLEFLRRMERELL